MVFCSECGERVYEGTDICPKCGCPLLGEIQYNKSVKGETVEPKTNNTINKSKRKTITTIICIIAIVLIACLCVIAIKGKQTKEDYYNNLCIATYSMLSGAADAEEAGNLIRSVWYNSIYEKSEPSTDKYTKKNGKFYSDFNDALSKLFSDSTFSKKIGEIESNQSEVASLLKKLQNPHDDYSDAYDALMKFYDAYCDLTACATNPTGTFQTYTSKLSTADDDVMKAYNSMLLYVDFNQLYE